MLLEGEVEDSFDTGQEALVGSIIVPGSVLLGSIDENVEGEVDEPVEVEIETGAIC